MYHANYIANSKCSIQNKELRKSTEMRSKRCIPDIRKTHNADLDTESP